MYSSIPQHMNKLYTPPSSVLAAPPAEVLLAPSPLDDGAKLLGNPPVDVLLEVHHLCSKHGLECKILSV